MNIIQSFKFKLDRAALEKYYVSFVRPILEYADVVWSGAHDCNLSKLDRVQLRAMRIVTGATERSNINNLYSDTGWSSLAERRKLHKLSWFYKILNHMTPSYLEDAMPSLVEERTHYDLRSGRNVSQLQTKKECYLKSFFPSTIHLWNSLPVEVRDSPTHSIFMSKVKSDMHTVKRPWYYVGERFTNIHLARLRIGCSMLNGHLYSNLRVIDDPGCLCGYRFEDPEHYFFHCPLFSNERAVLFNKLAQFVPLNVDILLYGKEDLSGDDNITISSIVQIFIKETGRFKFNLVPQLPP